MMDHQDVLHIMDSIKQIAENTQRIAVALERSNDLQEDANKLSIAALGMQQKHHEDNLHMTEEAKQEMNRSRRAAEAYAAGKGIMKDGGKP